MECSEESKLSTKKPISYERIINKLKSPTKMLAGGKKNIRACLHIVGAQWVICWIKAFNLENFPVGIKWKLE